MEANPETVIEKEKRDKSRAKKGHVVFHKLSNGNAYTPDSPAVVPVSETGTEAPFRLVFSCRAELTNGVTIVLPDSIVDGPAVISVKPQESPVEVSISRSAPREIPIPYVVYFDERSKAERANGAAGKHGYAESNSPPAMQVGP